MTDRWNIAFSLLFVFTLFLVPGCGDGDAGKSGGETEQGGQGTEGNGTVGANGTAQNTTTSNPMTPPGENPVYEVKTNAGSFTIELEPTKAPQTCSAFERNAQSNRYDGTIFHEVRDGGVIIGGGYMRNLSPRLVSMAIVNEADNGLKNVRGTVSMIRSPENKDSAVGDFFVNVGDNSAFDHQDETDEGFGYCVFGKVTAGMDVVDAISKKPITEQDGFSSLPKETVEITAIKKIR